MEQMDSVVPELTNGSWSCDKVNWATSYSYATQPNEEICLKVDNEGNVVHFDEEGFIRLLETSTDPYINALGAVFALGYLKGIMY